MKIQIVGGNFGDNPKESGIINKLVDLFSVHGKNKFVSINRINGGKLEDLPKYIDADLCLWMPNISNETEKQYPKKKPGCIVICSKVMRDNYTHVDSVSRIFKIHANAVIEIYKEENQFYFELRDALNNCWYYGYELNRLVQSIFYFTIFTKSANRIQTKQNNFSEEHYNQIKNICEKKLQGLIDVNKKLQNHIQTSCGNRFFGNLSTRCQKLFPTCKTNKRMFVSPRNINKESITTEDMVLYIDDTYYGDRKPSVDSPTQWRLYNNLPNINYMIHGHATFIHPDIETTENYCLCGDINEVDEVLKLVPETEYAFCINLKNHGFLIGADTIDHLQKTIDNIIDNQDVKIEITNSNG